MPTPIDILRVRFTSNALLANDPDIKNVYKTSITKLIANNHVNTCKQKLLILLLLIILNSLVNIENMTRDILPASVIINTPYWVMFSIIHNPGAVVWHAGSKYQTKHIVRANVIGMRRVELITEPRNLKKFFIII